MKNYNKASLIHKIGSGSVFIIAEIGSNHGGDFNIAKEAIDAAKEGGADAVKFQSISLNNLYYDPQENIRELHKKIDMEESWHSELQSYCQQKDILFFSSPTYMQAVDILESLDVQLYKLASAQVGVFPQIIDRVAALGKPTLLSTGLVTVGQMEKAINYFLKHQNHQFVILHCNSIYPTPPEKVCLDRIHLWQNIFQCPVGFSDHTEGISIPIAAVAKGASVIEKHFTLSRKMDTPDAIFSVEPDEFKNMVSGIRNVEAACKPCGRRSDIEQEEIQFKQSIRYRLVTKKAKNKGQSFEHNDFEYKRHDTGIDCVYEDIVLDNMLAARDIDPGELISWDMLMGAK